LIWRLLFERDGSDVYFYGDGSLDRRGRSLGIFARNGKGIGSGNDARLGLFAMESHKHPAELRNMVTSPGGTSSADAIYQMEKGGLRTVLSKAVYAAYQKAVALGQKK
jgi:hypothetical protein